MREDVKKGYEEGDWPGDISGDRELRDYEDELLSDLLESLPDEPSILDLGCGTGRPFDRWLVEHGASITGVDVVEETIEHARDNLPDQTFICQDFSQLKYEDAFDAIVSFYAIFHIPREEHGDLFERMHEWLRPNGSALLTLSPEPLDEHTAEFLGSEMVWSAWGPDKTRELLREASFQITKELEEKRPEAGEYHLWVLAQVQE